MTAATCSAIVPARGEVCGRPARARLRPGNSPVCGIHARAAEARSEGVEWADEGVATEAARVPSIPNCANRSPVTEDARAAAERIAREHRPIQHEHYTDDGDLLTAPGCSCTEDVVRDHALHIAELALASGRTETTTATDEDASRVISDAIRQRLSWASLHWNLNDPDDEGWPHIVASIFHALANARLLATVRTRPTRDDLAKVICESRWKVTAGEWRYDRISSPQRKSWLETADAVLALLADPPETTTEWAVRNDDLDGHLTYARDEDDAKLIAEARGRAVVRREFTAWREAYQ